LAWQPAPRVLVFYIHKAVAVRRILVTSALPYINGDIHLGYLLEAIQTDIWVRFQKLIGNRCVYMCADDTHGTATMIRARQEGRSEESLIAEVQAAHERDLADFDIQFDNYGNTHCKENRVLCGRVWRSIRAAGLVKQRDVAQLTIPRPACFWPTGLCAARVPNANRLTNPATIAASAATTIAPLS
jgi:methionyl-tRNA synthetase